MIMAISELVKRSGLNPKFIPILNLVLGLASGIIYISPTDLKMGIVQGLIMGLTAGGFYSSIKNVNEGLK